jgi:methionine synthase II (cobalamin-independent)
MGGVYRVPVLTARPAWRAPLLADEYRFACNALGALGTPSGKAGKLAVKAVLPGAYSLAKLSEAGDGIMNTMEARAEAFAEALAAEIQALASGGAEHIQVNEPAFFERDEDWPLFCRCVETVARARDAARQKGRKCDLTLSVSYTGAGHFYERLFELPMDVLALDCTGDNRLFERAAAAGSAKPLCLALVSGRNDQMEDAAALTRKLEGTLPNMSASRVYLGPSWGLETLPRDRARAKLELLARVRQNLSPSRATA